MGEKIVLDGSKREVARAVTKDSVVTCTKTSAPDVYVNAIIVDGSTTSLRAGDSAAVAKIATLRLHIFRTSEEQPFSASAELDLSVIT